jgi:hypothetical protein
MRATILTVLLTLAGALPAAAQDKAKPNTLTPKEIADGWILLFDGATTFGWAIQGQAVINDGWLVVGGKEESTIISRSAFPSQWRIRFDGYQTAKDKSSQVEVGNLVNGKVSGIGYGVGGTPTVFAGSGSMQQEHDRPVRIVIRVAANEKLYIRSFSFKAAETKPLLNGQDLSGWKAFPGKKSQFAVEGGAIHLKNGPGDLQTEGKYANFALQLECKSNGKHLNSGVFFRCKPNEYQNGYEAQIHNNFTADPAKSYTVEEFDPKTHTLLEKKKVKSAATDYGTGAIYRRVPARSGVAKDGEWFTMTIVAHGNHFATWVNGIQQVDWYDNRPASDNPRTGFRKEAGHISIQGHDPTTDLSFRNIRIAELP